MADLAAVAPFSSWWHLALAAALLVAAGFVWLHLHRIRCLQHLMDFDKRLKDLMNKAPVGILAYRKRALLYANEASLRLLGVPSVEMLSRMNPMDFFAPHERERILEYIAAREAGQPAPSGYEVAALRMTGESFLISVRISQVELNDGPANLMFMEDATERVATRAALEKSERDYRGLFEAAHDVILIFEPEDELILDANERACEMYGLPREKLVGRSLVDFSVDVATGKKRIKDIRTDGVLAGFQTIHRRHDGTLIFLDVNASIVEYQGRQAVLSIQRDITERLRAEDALRRSEENYRLLVENQTDLVVKVDPEGRFLFASPSYCELFGKTESELLGKVFLPLVHEEDRHAAQKAMQALDLWPNTSYVEQRAMTTLGWRWIAWNHRAVLSPEGRVNAVVGVGRDVTERRASEEALKESEQIFRALAESSSVTIAIYQGENLVYTNPTAEKLSGYTASELAGMPLARLMHPDYRDLLAQRAQARQRGEPVLSQYEAPLLTKDGGTRWLLVSAARITYKGQPAGLLTAFDVTERRAAEEHMRQSAHEIQAIFKALPDLYFRMDTDGKILEWRSGKDEDLFLRPEQFLGRRMQDVIPPDAAAAIGRALREVQRGAKTATAEYTLPMPGGDRSFEARLAPLFDGQVVAVVRNITERRRAEAEIEAWKHRFDLVSAASGQVVYDYHVPSGGILWSGSVEQVLGSAPGETGNIDEWSERIHPEDRAEAVRLLDEAERDSRPYDVEYRFRHQEGHYVHIHDRGFFMPDAAGKPLRMIGMMADITERKRTEEAVAASEAKLRLILENVQEIIYAVTFDLGPLTSTNSFVSAQVERLLGYTRQEFYDNPQLFLSILHPEDLDETKKVMTQFIESGEGGLRDYRLRHKTTGEYRWMEDRVVLVKDGEGHVVGFQGVARDVTDRKQAEEKLLNALHHVEDEKAKTDAVLAGMGDGVSIQDLDLKVLYQNEVHRRLIGDQVGQFCYQAYEGREGVCEGCPVALAYADGGTHTCTRSTMTPAGALYVEITASPLRDHTGAIVAGIECVRDVSERRRSEAALRESETRLRKIIDQSPISMAIVAMDGTIEYINRKAVETFGYEHEDIPTMDRWWVLAYPDEAYRRQVVDTYMGLVGKALAEGGDIEGREYQVTCKDGSVKTMSIFGVPVADKVFVMFQDMTERVRAEEALRAGIEQQRALVENARAIVLQFDSDLTITYWNDYAAEFFGFAREEALGASLLDTVVPRTDTVGRNLEVMIRDIALDPNRFAANINENLTKDGRRVWVAWSNRPKVDAHGRLTGVLSIGTDITELKHAEEELRLRNRQLLAVSASAHAMGQFTDVRTAMQSICEAAISAFPASMAWVGLIVPESTEVTPLASAGRDEGYTDQVRVRWDLSPRAMGPVGRAINTRKSHVMRVDEPDFAPWREEATKRGFRTVCALPLTHGESVRGVIALYSEDPEAFGPGTFDILDIFASQCAMVLVNAALYEEAHRTIQELWKANEELKKG